MTFKQQLTKQHNDLKTQFLQFKTNISTQVKGVESAVRELKTTQTRVIDDVKSITCSQEFISKEYEDIKKANQFLQQQSSDLFKNKILILTIVLMRLKTNLHSNITPLTI